MSRDLLPVDAACDSLESFLHPLSRASNAIYVMVILLIAATLSLLPVIRVGVSVQAPGIIRPAIEKHEVVASASGFVESVEARPNELVHEGTPLLRMVVEPLGTQLSLNEDRIVETAAMIRDLDLLTARAVASADELRTDLYRNEHRQLVEQLVGIELREKHARQGLERTLDLVELGLAPRTDAEDAEFALAGLEAERSSLIQARVGTWHTRRDQLQEELVRLRERRTLLEEDRARSVVRAPISGTLEQMVNVSAGSFVQAGERLATVSPSAELVAEVFVSPADFGLLEVGAPVRLLIDAFNYSDWGFIPGQVLELPDDVLMLEGQPVYRTIVRMEATELVLPTSVRRKVKKGMTLRARFMVAERSLWQLLRDDINDWLNPIQRPAQTGRRTSNAGAVEQI